MLCNVFTGSLHAERKHRSDLFGKRQIGLVTEGDLSNGRLTIDKCG